MKKIENLPKLNSFEIFGLDQNEIKLWDKVQELIDAVNLLTGEEQCFAEGKTNSGHPTVCLARKPCPEHDKSLQEPPKEKECQNCKNGCMMINNFPCHCECHTPKPELNVEVLLEEYRHLRYDSAADHRRKQQIIATLKDIIAK